MKTYITTLSVFFGIIILFIVGVFLTQQYTVEETEDTAYEIVEVIPTVSGNHHTEYTVFVIDTGDGKYTLPKIPTRLVRCYHEGDVIPVTVNTLRNGTKEIIINRKELE